MIGTSKAFIDAIDKLIDIEDRCKHAIDAGTDVYSLQQQARAIRSGLKPIDEIYKLPATGADIERLASITGSGFILGVGLDRAQVIAIAPDRTVMVLTARAIITEEVSIYFILDIFIPKIPTMPVLTERIIRWSQEFGWLDKIAIEAYQGQDLFTWCQDRGFESELISPTYKSQLQAFTAMCVEVRTGHLKCPRVPYYTDEDGDVHDGFTDQKEDIFREEMSVFAHNADKKWFGAPDKRRKGGIKDDLMYATAWSIYATQGESSIGMDRSKGGDLVGDFSGAHINRDVLGEY